MKNDRPILCTLKLRSHKQDKTYQKEITMKISAIAAAAALLAITMTGCAGGNVGNTGSFGKNKAPKHWYNKTLDYYKAECDSHWKANLDPKDYELTRGITGSSYIVHADGTKEEVASGYEEYQDENNRFGYYLTDLDGDGTDEVLIGIVDDSEATKFMELCIWHNDFGAYNPMTNGNGYYFYLCEDGIIRNDTWYGSKTKTEYMKYDSEENSWPIIEPETPPKPLKCTLVPFDEIEVRETESK